MRFANPAGLWLAALTVPVLLLHVLKPRRERQTVASTFLWREVASPVAAASPWQRLVPSVLLFLQLLAVLALALAVAEPVRAETTPLAAHTVFIVDASASMGARDGAGGGARVDEAIERMRELADERPDDGVVSVVVAGARAQVVLSSSDDEASLAEAVAPIRAGEGPADFAGAFSLARSLETPGVPIGFVLLSDGGLRDADRRLAPLGTRYEPVGSRSTNRGVTALTVASRGSGLHAIATVANTGGGAAVQTLRLDVDGVTEHTAVVDLDPGEVVQVEADLPLGERVEAFLEGEDLLDLDDHRYALAPTSRDLTVLLAGPPDAFLDVLLESLDGLTVVRSDVAIPAPDADLAIYNRVAVPDDPGVPYLAIAPPGGAPGIDVVGEVERPAIALVDSRDALLDQVDLSGVAVAVAQEIEAPLATTLVGAEGAPLLVRGSDAGRRFLYLAFAPGDSNLPLQIAFPVLGDRIVAELAGATAPPGALVAGDRLPADVAETVTVTRPEGSVVVLPPGSPTPVADRAGFWQVAVGDHDPVTVAVNPDPRESELSVASTLPIEAALRDRGAAADSGTIDVGLGWLLGVPILALLAAEFLAARRRVGVSRRQWRAAVVARLALAAMLVAAFADVAIVRPANRVATMFVVDASDSLGPGGRSDAVEWVQAALADQPDGALAGVVLFGADARLEATLTRQLELGRPAVQIDPTNTDLATAIRLAGAVLPTDARRRVVLVSDGRATAGDAAEEAAGLGASGIGLDVHVVGGVGGVDVAVSDLSVPGRVRDGESVTIAATVVATTAGPAIVTLVRDGVAVSERTVALDAGTNRLTFTDIATGSGVARYQVRVGFAGDTIVDNDVAFAATQIDGPARVLLVEGRPGNALTLRAALDAAGLVTEVVPVTAIPPVDELAGIATVVLVDVDARALAPEHVDALRVATSDLGRGLVTVGGTQSYGLGGYLGSDLESLLPVVSEILDPQRRQSVAEVLAIDTSGSMGACHCAEGGQMGGGLEGGANKTDISRAGAARAIEQLAAIDEVGVLAVDTKERWIIDLQQVPAQDVVNKGLRDLVPSGDATDLSRSLTVSAEALRASDAALKHVILFTDGFVDEGQFGVLESEAASLLAEGITVSVVATGEGASQELQAVADAGGGRFYPGRDLQQVPEILAQEAVLASRDFVQEGSFVPEITSASRVVADLASSPPLFGYVATTSKPAATTHLRLGPERDPLLVSWQAGLGRVTSWTSDLDRWGQSWSGWDGFVDFWATVVADTFPLGDGAGGVRARVEDEVLTVVVDGADAFAEGAQATARVALPDGKSAEVPLTRTGPAEFTGELAVGAVGTYAVGAQVQVNGTTVVAGTALATRSFSEEYVPGDSDEAALLRLSDRAGGRGAIDPDDAFSSTGLESGRRRTPLAPWLLLAAALLFPVAVTLSRLSLRGAPIVERARYLGALAAWRVRRAAPSRPDRVARDRAPPAPPERPAPPPAAPPVAPPATLGSLLAGQRRRKGIDDADESPDG